MNLEFEKDEMEALKVIATDTAASDLLTEDRVEMAKNRKADITTSNTTDEN